MDWRNGVLSEFAEAMGIKGFDFGDTGVACFQIEGTGSFYIESQEDGVLMYLAREMDKTNSLPTLEKALMECHYKNSFPYSLQLGIRESELVLCLFVNNSDFNRPSVESVMKFLTSKADSLEL